MASKVSLSRLRLSPHYSALSRFHASDGASKLRLEAEDAASCEEALHICRHLDLECEVLTDTNSPGTQARQLLIRRNDLDFPEEGPPPEPAEVITHSTAQLPAPPARKRPRQGRAAAEAEHMLSVAPPGLSKFYAALIDHFPGYRGKLAKLMVAKLHAAGYSGPCSSSSSSSSSSASSSKKKKKKKKKKKAKKKKATVLKPEADVDEVEAGAKAEPGSKAEVKVEPAEEEVEESAEEGEEQRQGRPAEGVKPLPRMDPELEAELDAELALA